MRWIVVLLVAASLAGCIGGDSETLDPVDTSHSTVSDGSNETASFVKAILGLNVSVGPAPLAVHVALSAPGYPGSSWNLTSILDGNVTHIAHGNSTPAGADHVFAIGDHTLRLVITTPDGHNATTERIVRALGPEPPAPPVPLPDHAKTLHFEGAMNANPNPTEPAAIQRFPMDVPAGIEAVTLWTSWTTAGDPLSSPLPSDLDTYLVRPDGTVAYAGETLDFEYGHVDGPIEKGTWSIEIHGFSVPHDTTFRVDAILWKQAPHVMTATGSFVGSAGPEGERVGDEPVLHSIPVPAGANAIAARLTWSVPELQAEFGGTCNEWDRVHDLDFVGALGNHTLGSGNFAACEFGFLDADADIGGIWKFTVSPYLAAHVDYELTVLFA